MTQFDALLRQGLMDANLAQYERILKQIETETPDFSPQYRRERMRFLAAPCNWEKKRTRPVLRRGIFRGIAVAIAVILLATVAVAVTAPLWITFFGGLDQRQQEIVGDMEITDGREMGSGEAEKTAEESLLPPPVEHDGVTITPLSILAAKNQLYMVLEIRAPEGTVFRQEDDYYLFASTNRPKNAPAGMTGGSGRFTVVEAGTKEPNVLLGIAEEKTSYDISGCTYQIRALYQSTPDGEQAIFEASDNVTWKTGTWDIHIPEELNRDQVIELSVEGVSMTDGQKTMTLLSMSVSPLGVWWKYQLDGEDPWPRVRIALRMRDGSEVEASSRQLTMGDMGSGCTATVEFEKPVDLSQAGAVLWGGVEIPLEQIPENN